MLIPIGRQGAEAPRKTWLCYLFVGLNIWIFVMTAMMSASVMMHSQSMQSSWLAAMRYLSEHPDLHIAPELQPLVPRDLQEQLDARPKRPETLGASDEQQELDRLSAPLLELYQRLPESQFGFVPARWSFWRMLTSMFIHGSLMHLFGNMAFLLATGPFLEEAFGWKVFGFLYLTGGLFSTAVWGLRHEDSFVPLVGASGAIAVVMGAYFVRFFKSRIEFWFVPILLLWKWRYRFALPAFLVLPLWFVYQFVWMRYEEGSGVAFAVHVSGFLYGAMTSLLLIVTKPEKGIDRSETDAAILIAYEKACDQKRWAAADGYANQLLDRTVAERPEHTLELVRRICSRDASLPKFLARTVAIAERNGDRALAIWLHERIVATAADTPAAMRSNFRLGVLRRQAGDLEGARTALLAAREHQACTDDMRAAIDARLTSS
jgi:membrane associated rhomboid family serine protease